MLRGIAASSGIGIGRAVLLRPQTIVPERKVVGDPLKEQSRFQAVVEQFSADIVKAYEAISRHVGKAEAEILSVQGAIVRDPQFSKQVLRYIMRERVSAEYAVGAISDRYVALFAGMSNEVMRSRAADFRDIRARLIDLLLGIEHMDLAQLPAESILIAEDIPPSHAANIDPANIAGIITQQGTRYSHISIIARALQIPAVVGVEGLFEAVRNNDPLIVDGGEGVVVQRPSKEQMSRYEARRQLKWREQAQLGSFKNMPTITADGRRVLLASNLAANLELPHILENNADGIGLYRTELLYMGRNGLPDEEEQFQEYRKILQMMGDKPVAIRTLDIGGDKNIPYMGLPKEKNPYLGYRGVRFCLGRTDIFKTQLSALLRAGRCGNLKIMIPMVSSVAELRRVKALLELCKADLTERGEAFREDVPLGVMIETPAAALCAEALAKEADFFSIGTNDLTQYTLAVDRGNEYVSRLYSTLHPAVLQLILMTVRAANNAGIPVAVCGEAAADPLLIPFLVGAGVDELSVTSGSLLVVRQQVCGISYTFWREKAEELAQLSTISEVGNILQGLLH